MYENQLKEFIPIIEKTKLKSNIHRTGVSGVKYRGHYSGRTIAIGNPIKSQSFGLLINRLKDRYNLSVSAQNEKFPECYEALKQIANIIDPDFKYNTITLNKNVKARLHKDGSNVGISMIVAIGDFTGGGLYVENLETGEMELHDIKYNPVYFNGYLSQHETEEFTGERYSIIYYNTKIKTKKTNPQE